MTAFAAWVTERMAFKVHSAVKVPARRKGQNHSNCPNCKCLCHRRHLGVTVDDEVSLS